MSAQQKRGQTDNAQRIADATDLHFTAKQSYKSVAFASDVVHYSDDELISTYSERDYYDFKTGT